MYLLWFVVLVKLCVQKVTCGSAILVGFEDSHMSRIWSLLTIASSYKEAIGTLAYTSVSKEVQHVNVILQ